MLTKAQRDAFIFDYISKLEGTPLEGEYHLDINFTCDDCTADDKCKFAFNLYNTNGDCLAAK
jgi:hypothetical protein